MVAKAAGAVARPSSSEGGWGRHSPLTDTWHKHLLIVLLKCEIRSSCGSNVLFFFFFFFFFWPPPGIWRSLATHPLRSCTLHTNCSKAGSFNPLCKARDQTCLLALQRRRRRSQCATAGTPVGSFLITPLGALDLDS